MLLFFYSSLGFLYYYYYFFDACVLYLFWSNYASNIFKLLNRQCVRTTYHAHNTVWTLGLWQFANGCYDTKPTIHTAGTYIPEGNCYRKHVTIFLTWRNDEYWTRNPYTWQQHTETSLQTHALYIVDIYTGGLMYCDGIHDQTLTLIYCDILVTTYNVSLNGYREDTYINIHLSPHSIYLSLHI